MERTELRDRLRQLDEQHDEVTWPTEQVALLTEAGVWRASVAIEHGGERASATARVETYEHVAAGSLNAALILTQHDGACELLGKCNNAELAARLLPKFATGELLTTVGISQLTTSQRGDGPAMRAEPTQGGFLLNGYMPWVTSAANADYVVTGAVLPDGQQILACIPTDIPGLEVPSPMKFVALTASWTGQILCRDVRVTDEHLMRGPAEQVLAIRAPVKSLTVSAVGIGVAAHLLDRIAERSKQTGGTFAKFEEAARNKWQEARQRLYEAAKLRDDPSAEIPAQDIRASINDLLTRLATTYMVLSKGSGYLAGHPAQKLLRETAFFLVWSAPTPVQIGTLERIWDTNRH